MKCKMLILLTSLMVSLSTTSSAVATLYDFETSGLPSEFTVTGDGIPNVSITSAISHSGNSSLAIGSSNYGLSKTALTITLPSQISNGTISWWQYDAFGGNSPYYMYAGLAEPSIEPAQYIGNFSPDKAVVQLDLLDSGWSQAYQNNWSTNLMYDVVGQRYYGGPTRVAGTWSQYELLLSNNSIGISVNSTLLGTFDLQGKVADKMFFFYENCVGGEPAQYYIDDLNITNNSSAPVPEPSTFLLFGLGIAGTVFYRHRSKKA